MATTHDKPGFSEAIKGRKVEVLWGAFKGETGIAQGTRGWRVLVTFPPTNKPLELWVSALKLRFVEA